MRILTPEVLFIDHRFEVVEAAIPKLLDLDLVDSALLYPDNVDSILFGKRLNY